MPPGSDPRSQTTGDVADKFLELLPSVAMLHVRWCPRDEAPLEGLPQVSARVEFAFQAM